MHLQQCSHARVQGTNATQKVDLSLTQTNVAGWCHADIDTTAEHLWSLL